MRKLSTELVIQLLFQLWRFSIIHNRCLKQKKGSKDFKPSFTDKNHDPISKTITKGNTETGYSRHTIYDGKRSNLRCLPARNSGSSSIFGTYCMLAAWPTVGQRHSSKSQAQPVYMVKWFLVFWTTTFKPKKKQTQKFNLWCNLKNANICIYILHRSYTYIPYSILLQKKRDAQELSFLLFLLNLSGKCENHHSREFESDKKIKIMRDRGREIEKERQRGMGEEGSEREKQIERDRDKDKVRKKNQRKIEWV